jgi:hypothetical protein
MLGARVAFAVVVVVVVVAMEIDGGVDTPLEATLGERLLCHVREPAISQSVIVGSVAAAATTGALIAMGHRVGHAAIPFAAVGAVATPRAAGGGAVGLVFIGFVFHLAAIMVWSVVFLWLARRLARPVLAAAAVSAANFFASWLVAWSSGAGLASALPLGDRIAFAVVLALSLVVGMRYAFSASQNAASA